MSDKGHCPSEAEIVEALNTAVLENYYTDLVRWPDADIATDLWLYHPDVDCEVNDPRLYAGIKAWRAQLPNQNFTTSGSKCDTCNGTEYTTDNPFVLYRCPRPSDPKDMCCTLAGHAKCFHVSVPVSPGDLTAGGWATGDQWEAWITSKEARKAGFLFLT